MKLSEVVHESEKVGKLGIAAVRPIFVGFYMDIARLN